jgi:hypothetical protein
VSTEIQFTNHNILWICNISQSSDELKLGVDQSNWLSGELRWQINIKVMPEKEIKNTIYKAPT